MPTRPEPQAADAPRAPVLGGTEGAQRRGGTVFTIRGFLDAPLGSHDRLRELELLCGQFDGRPLHDSVADLRGVLATAPVTGEDYRRLHILISHLYHRCGADVPLTRALRAEVGDALARRIAVATRDTGEEEGHVVSH